jgi:uncharacterized membrane protein YphA (DoxX/SURF4 family)
MTHRTGFKVPLTELLFGSKGEFVPLATRFASVAAVEAINVVANAVVHRWQHPPQSVRP